MHRGGTSLLTRILNLIGVDLGSPELFATEPVADNPKGYWEHNEIIAISDAILKRYGGGWDEPPLLPPGWETAPAISDLKHQAQQLIQHQFAAAPLWGWKDPRTCLTLPFWQQLLPNMRYIICLRNPVDVVRSLEDRNGMSAEKASSLWFTYVSAALKHTEGKPRLLIFYEDVMDDSLRELQRLAEFIGRPERAKEVDVQEAVQEFIEKDLQHHRSSILQATASPRIDLRAKALYIAQRISVSFGREQITGQQGSDNQIYKALDALSRYSFRASGQINPLAEQLAELEDQSADSRSTIRGMQADLVELNRKLETTAVRLTESEQARKTLSSQLVEKDGIVRALSTRAAEQSRALQAQAECAEEGLRMFSAQLTQAEWAEERIRVLSAQLLDTEAELQRIKKTLGWQLLSRYKRVKQRYFLPIYRMFNQRSAKPT
jgi:hypothetical protein